MAPPPKASVWHLLLLTAVVLAVMWPLTTFDFVSWDDPHNVAENPDMTPPTVASVAKYWDPRRPYKDLYIPFTYTFWAGLASLAYVASPDGGSLTPQVFHTANVILHVLSGVIVFVILLRLVGKPWAAWVGAALFCVHPVQVESVAWVSGMKDLLCGLLSLMAIWLYVEHAQRAGQRWAWWFFAGATVAFVLAMLSKPSAVVVPLIAAVIDVGLLRRPVRRVAVLVAPWLVLSAVVVLIARSAQPAARLDFVPPAWGRPIVALDAVAFYLKQVLFPIRLGIDYGRSPQRLWESSERFYSWVLPVALCVVLVIFRRRARVALAAGGIFVLGVLPVLGLIPFDFQAYSTVADHYLYLAMLGAALLVAWVVSVSRGRLVVPVACAAVFGFGVRSFMQTWSWQSSRELYAHTLRVNRWSLLGNVSLANVLSREGVEAVRLRDPNKAAAAFETARHYYRVALRVRPQDVEARTGLANVFANLGRVYLTNGDYGQALAHLHEALRLDPAQLTAAADLKIASQRSSAPPTTAPAGP